jgi:hypothetical protein
MEREGEEWGLKMLKASEAGYVPRCGPVAIEELEEK